MDAPEQVPDNVAWWLASAYIDAWNRRDRDAWLALLHDELEFRPTALVGTGVVYQGLDGAARYFDDLIAGNRPEQARITGLRRIAADRILLEMELLIDERPVSKACVLSQVRDGKFVETSGYLSDATTLASIGAIPEDAPVMPRPGPEPN